jgi:hypothetical protein
VNVSENWWGTVNEEKIRQGIFEDTDSEKSVIKYRPFLKSRVQGAGI